MTSKLIGYFKLIRPINILMIIYVQVIIKYVVFEKHEVLVAMDDLQFALLVLATVLIAAAGNVVNDIFDVNVDSINKPAKVIVWRVIPERAAYNFYIILNVLGVAVGFYLSNQLGRPGLAAIFIVISALLYIYATHLKAMLLVGNILISLLVAMSLLVMVLFDIFPAIEVTHRELQIACTRVILLYAGFAFFINLIREIVKDLEDIDGDRNGGRNTLAIVFGRKRAASMVFVLGVVAMFAILLYTYQNISHFKTITISYLIFLVCAPLLYFCIQAWDAESKKQFARLSVILKIIMITGIGSLFFITETI
ncbi:MAG: geranylgeranylglycerol-phosphate geranylgeranyltransferase [Bacteroidota bacterium]